MPRVNFHTERLCPFIVEYLLEPFHVEDIRFVAVFYSWSRLDLSSLANLLASSTLVSTILVTPSRFMELLERRGLLLSLEHPLIGLVPRKSSRVPVEICLS